MTKKIAVGRYARITNFARTNVIGRVVAHTDKGAVVRVPNFHADGMERDCFAEWSNIERSTAAACKAAANGGWS